MTIILGVLLSLFCLFLIAVIIGAGKWIQNIRNDLEIHGIIYDDHKRVIRLSDELIATLQAHFEENRQAKRN